MPQRTSVIPNVPAAAVLVIALLSSWLLCVSTDCATYGDAAPEAPRDTLGVTILGSSPFWGPAARNVFCLGFTRLAKLCRSPAAGPLGLCDCMEGPGQCNFPSCCLQCTSTISVMAEPHFSANAEQSQYKYKCRVITTIIIISANGKPKHLLYHGCIRPSAGQQRQKPWFCWIHRVPSKTPPSASTHLGVLLFFTCRSFSVMCKMIFATCLFPSHVRWQEGL